MLNQYFSNITPMQEQKKPYPSQSPLTNTQPTKTHKPDKHTTQQNQQAHNTTKPTSTPHKSNNSQQQKDWPLLTEHKHSEAWFRARDLWVMSPTH